VPHYYTGIKFVEQPVDGSAGLAPERTRVRLIDEFGNFQARENIPISLGSRRIAPDVPDASPVGALEYTDISGTAVFNQIFVQARGTHVLTARFFDYLFLAQKAAFEAIAGNSGCISRAKWNSYLAAQQFSVMQNSSAFLNGSAATLQNSSAEDGAVHAVPGEGASSFESAAGTDECLDLHEFLRISPAIIGSAEGDAASSDDGNATCTTAASEFHAEPGEQARICAARRSAATGLYLSAIYRSICCYTSLLPVRISCTFGSPVGTTQQGTAGSTPLQSTRDVLQSSCGKH